jgi:hypothetical protein
MAMAAAPPTTAADGGDDSAAAALLAALAREVNSLSDSDRALRRRALDTLSQRCVRCCGCLRRLVRLAADG